MKLFFRKENYFEIFVLVFLLAWFGVFLLHKIDLTTADLGRHLKNGELILKKNFGILKTNFYSYTYPDYPFLNHHWLAGVIFFLIWKIGGFLALHLFSIILSLIIFLIFFQIAQKKAGLALASVTSLLVIPLLSQRAEIRPEIFTYFFTALFFWILWHYREGIISSRFLFVLPFLEVLWVNTHIYFFLGPVIIGAFLLEKIILFLRTRKGLNDKFFIVFGLCVAATLLNPFGLKGAIHPFNVYKNYGYRVLEEQSVLFLERLGFIKNPNFLLFKVVFSVLTLSFILVLIKNRQRFPLVNFFLGLGFSVMAWLAIRNFTLFGFFALPIIANNIKIITSEKNEPKTLEDFIGITALGLGIFIITLTTHSQRLSFDSNKFGLGLVPENNAAAEFFQTEGLQGPIFNNYDIGGYLIYYLYPEHRVFIDNRPEVYPVSFFQDVYIPLQENNEIWKEQDEFYNFNAIFFSHRDATPWGQKFLIERVKDDSWSPVFVDNFAIIFLKRNNLNEDFIKKYEIPKEYFKIRTIRRFAPQNLVFLASLEK